MPDIIDELRSDSSQYTRYQLFDLCDRAAGEIATLRRQLREVNKASLGAYDKKEPKNAD